jgi:GxxExxY protein
MKKCDEITEQVIGCAIRVHEALGPGLLESVYDAALSIELEDSKVLFERQVRIPAVYRGHTLGHYRLDFVVDEQVVVEIKSVKGFKPVFEAQMLTYLRIADLPVGLLINFNSRLLTSGLHRYVSPKYRDNPQ